MTTHKKTILPTIPIYLQKYIVRILCCHIDSVNRGFKNDESNEQRIKDENDIRKCIEHISLVNHTWFQTISNNLTVSVDFISYHYNSNVRRKHSNSSRHTSYENHYITKRLNYGSRINGENIIFKNENIKQLLLNMEDWGDTDEKQMEPILLLVNQVVNSREEWKIPSKVKEIFTVTVKRSYSDKPRYVEFFRSLLQIDTLLCGELNIDFKFIYDNLIIDQTTIKSSMPTCFSNTNRFNAEGITIENCYYMFKLMPKISKCGLNICIDDLIYQLSGIGGRGNSIPVKPCLCGIKLNDANNNFKQYWKFIVDTIKDHKFLKMLVLVHSCPFSPVELDTESVTFMPKMFNDKLSFQLTNELEAMLSTNKSLLSFHLGNIPNSKFRINDNVLNQFK